MAAFLSYTGIITMINDFWTGATGPNGCYKLITVQGSDRNIVNFVVTPITYFVDHARVAIGDQVVGFSDANAPVPLIYPPQYQALVMAKVTLYQSVKVDFFNSQLISSDGTLKLNIGLNTQVLLENGQDFTQNPANHNLIIVYGPSTRSIPAQTTPYKIIVMC